MRAIERVASGNVLRDPLHNRGTAYGPEERERNARRSVAAAVATAVATVAYEQRMATKPRAADLAASIRATMYRPAYA